MLERLLSPGSSTPPGRVGSRGAVADATTLRFGRAPCRTKSALRPRVATASPFHRGCRTKPSAKMRGALAEVHARAVVRDDLAPDRPLATAELAVFGTHP